MHEKFHCRRCERGSAGRRPFKMQGASPHYAPDLPVKLDHLLLEATVDPVGKILKGVVTQRVRVIAPGQRRFKLDQIGLMIEEAKMGDHVLPFTVEGDALFLDLPKAVTTPTPGDLLEFSVRYQVKNSKRGLYFTGPDSDYPKKPYQVWSQGQDEDTRYWIPTFDYPNQKALTEVIAIVPKGYTAVSNGALLSEKDQGEWTRFHYKLGTPHVTYLITLVVAEFKAWADEGPGGVPVQYFVGRGLEENGRRAFGNTPKMIQAFSQKVGVPYPYEKYSQVAVQDFIFGGMENTSATTQTDRTLHDERAHLDFSSDPLVSHELAHQWFGDLLTCRDWSHGWLNEGFATFMERVWVESNSDEYGSPEAALDEGKYYSYTDLKEYCEENSRKYRRPIVCNTYQEPIDLFDAHLYQKGGLVLNLIRSVLGEEQFWKSIHCYVTRHRGQSVETLDLIRAIEDTTGRNLRRFFDEWIFSAGHPELEVSYQWHEDKKLAEFVIEQKQTDGKPELVQDGFTVPLFHLPVRIELTLEGSQESAKGGIKKTSHLIEIGELRDRIFLPAESKPVMVRLDPAHSIPKVMKFPRPKELLLYQLTHDGDCMGRIEAAHELVKIADYEGVAALGRAVLSDSFWGVQAEAADALAEIRTDQAMQALIAGLKVSHPKARRAVVKALGTYKDPKAGEALKKLAEKDPSYFVEAEATRAWTGSRNKTGGELQKSQVDETETFLMTQFSKESHLEVIRTAALWGLAELPGVGRGERPKAFETLLEWSKRGKPEDARMAAIGALGQVASVAVPSERALILDRFNELADEESFRVRMRLILALGASESPVAIPILDKIHRLDSDGRVKRDSKALMNALMVSGTPPESVVNLKVALEKLEEEHRKLKSWVDETRATGKVGK